MENNQIETGTTVKKTRKNKKHFVLYNNGGVISATTPKNWARANQNSFPQYDFINSDNTPTVEVIEAFLIQTGFTRMLNDEIVILYNYLAI